MARIAIVGAGAIGGLIAAKLASAGHQLVLVARGEHLQAIKANGLTVLDQTPGSAGHSTTVRLPASDDAADFGPQDAVFLCVKGPAIAGLLPRIRSLLAPQTMVIPAINGLPWWYFCGDTVPTMISVAPTDAPARESSSTPRRIACLDPKATMFADLDSAHIIGCVVYLAADLIRPGVIAHTAARKLVLGELTNQPSERLTRLSSWCTESGLDTQVSTNVRRDLWTKLVGNLSFNPVAALTGELMDKIVDNDDLLAIIRPMIDEGTAVAAAMGITIPVTTAQRIESARSIGPVRLSTLQDFDAGRRPELEGLLESVIELAQWTGVAVPTIRQIAALLRAKARSQGLLRHDG